MTPGRIKRKAEVLFLGHSQLMPNSTPTLSVIPLSEASCCAEIQQRVRGLAGTRCLASSHQTSLPSDVASEAPLNLLRQVNAKC